MKKGALASGALALGGSAIGSASAQEDGDTGTGGAGETVLMLHPDAVENADFTVASGEVSWSPIEDGAAGDVGGTDTDAGDDMGADGNETDDDGGLGGDETEDDGGLGGDETPAAADGGTTPDDGGTGDFTTYMIEYGFSASHVAPVFVEGDVDLSEGDERQLGDIEEIVEQPGGGTGGVGDGADDDGGLGGNETEDDGGLGGDGGAGQEGEALYVRVALEDSGGVGGETPTEDGTEEPGGDTTPGDDTTPGGDGGDGGGLFDF